MQIKNTALVSIVCLVLVGEALSVHSENTPHPNTIFVFKLDGAMHCEPDARVSVDSMAGELTSAGIEVFSRRNGYDGREGVAVCGAPTGQINIYEIASSDLSAALRLGFKQLPQNLIVDN